MSTTKNAVVDTTNVEKIATPLAASVAAEEKPSRGVLRKMPGQGIMPRESGQLFVKIEGGDVVVHGYRLTEGAAVRQLIAGPVTVDFTKGDKIPEAGIPVKTGVFVILIVVNETDGALACEGGIFVEGGPGVQKTAAVAVTPAASKAQVVHPPVAGTRTSPPLTEGIFPGRNEVAVVMRRGDAQRVFEILSARDARKFQTLTDHERPALVRPFEDALKRGT